MNSSSSGKGAERFLAGKGFYIVLFLCAAVIGVSAWVMAAGNRAMENSELAEVMGRDQRVETVTPRPAAGGRETEEIEFLPPEIGSGTIAEPPADETGDEPLTVLAAADPGYVWPVRGSIDRAHSVSDLGYDVTMRDWRTHSGVDILCDSGTPVVAARGGVVESVVCDGLYGTTITIDHGDGMRSVYANLAEQTLVAEGEWVDAGVEIGLVGASAIGEISQQPHLHFAMTLNGADADPEAYLPG